MKLYIIKVKKAIFTAVLLLLSVGDLYAQQLKLSDRKLVTIHSLAENSERTFIIQLPKSYSKLNTRFPLILLFDAQDQSLFNYTSSVIDRLMSTNDIPEAIFVGVVQNNRSKELSVERNEASSVQFLNFIKDDLISYLNKNYELNGYYTLIGHSLGGQFVTNTLMVFPQIFKSVISISGALNYPDSDQTYKKKVLTRLQYYLTATNSANRSLKQKYYFAVGDEGFQDTGFRIGALTADSLFKVHNPPFINWRFDNLKGFNHMTTPLLGIPAGLVYIFHDWHFSDSLAMDVLIKNKTDPLIALQLQKDGILKSYGTDITLPYSAYYQFEQYYFDKGDMQKAKVLADQIITLYPGDENSYLLMSDVLIKQGDKRNAIKYLMIAQSKSLPGRYQKRIDALKIENK